MQIQCPKCKQWIESTDGNCPLCRANLSASVVDLPKSFYIKQTIKKIILVIMILALCGGLIVLIIYYVSKPDDDYSLLIAEPSWQNSEGCLPPYEAIEVPKGTDRDTILKMEQELYQIHQDRSDCLSKTGYGKQRWASRIGSGWLSKKNARVMAKNPMYQLVLSGTDGTAFIDEYEGCHGFPVSTEYDSMRLYIRSPKEGSIEMAFASNVTPLQTARDYDGYNTRLEKMPEGFDYEKTRKTLHNPDYPVDSFILEEWLIGLMVEIPDPDGYQVEPVNHSPILYGVDQDHYSESTLKQIKNTPYYSFYSGEVVLANMKKGHFFKVVLHVQRNEQSFLLYRVYPLSRDIETDAQYFDKACKY